MKWCAPPPTSIRAATAVIPTTPRLCDTWFSFADLRRAGIVDSWKTLRDWQRDPRIGFPLGRLLAPNTRRWSLEIDPWLANRPVERDAFDYVKREQRAKLGGAMKATA